MSTPETPEDRNGGALQPERDEKTTAEFEFVPLAPEKIPKGRARYRDPANPFNTWTGLGKRPAWLSSYIDAGHDLSEYEIKDTEP